MISLLAQKVDRECSLGEHSARLTVRSGMVINKTPFLPLGFIVVGRCRQNSMLVYKRKKS